MKATKVIKRIVKEQGCIEIQSGVYLHTREDILAEQNSWSDQDAYKYMDFSTYKYWITTNDGVKPEGFDTISEILNTF